MVQTPVNNTGGFGAGRKQDIEMLPDDKERIAAVTDFSQNIIVEAGAGSGKTTLLVERAVNLLLTGAVEPRQLAAITFTEKAAAQLAQKMVSVLDEILGLAMQKGKIEGSPAAIKSFTWLTTVFGLSREDIATRAEEVLEHLDEATLTTLHGLCAEILRSRPREAGVDPSFWVDKSERGFQAALDSSWREFLRNHGDVLKEKIGDLTPAEFKKLAGLLGRPDIPGYFNEDPSQGSEAADTNLRKIGQALASQALSAQGQIDPKSKSKYGLRITSARLYLEAFVESGRIRDHVTGAPFGLEEYLNKKEGGPGKSYSNDQINQMTVVAKSCQKFLRAISCLGGSQDIETIKALGVLASRVQDQYLKSGVLSFGGLIIQARDLLRDNLEVRQFFKNRYKSFLLDEFQDTNPLQYEILFYLSEKREGRSSEAYKVILQPGKLFCVGDPKQAIYGFQGADLQAFEMAVDHIVGQKGQRLVLSANFRSVPEILEPVNKLIGPRMKREEGLQPKYQKLFASRAPAGGARVTVWKIEGGSASVRRQKEADLIAWDIQERMQAKGTRYSDFAVLFRGMTGLSFYLSALHRAGVPFVVSGGRTYSGRREVQEALALLRLLAGPENPADLLAIMRSSIGGCSDTELLEFSRTQPWSVEATPDPGKCPRAASLLNRIKEIRQDLASMSPIGWVELIFRQSGFMAILASSREGARKTANVMKLSREINEFMWREGISLREALDHWEKFGPDGSSDDGGSESPLADEEVNAVRLLTIHKAKGLEFPIVYIADVAGAIRANRNRSDNPIFVAGYGSEEALAFRLPNNKQSSAAVLHDWLRVQKDEAELLRLAYVAMTRARDHLIMYVPPRDDVRASDGAWLARMNWLEAWGLESGIPCEGVLLNTVQTQKRILTSPQTANVPLLESALERSNQLRKMASSAPPWRRTATQANEQDPRNKDVISKPVHPRAGSQVGPLLGEAVHRLLNQEGMSASQTNEETLKNIVQQVLIEGQELEKELLSELVSLIRAKEFSQTLENLVGVKTIGQEMPLLFMDKNSVVCEGRIDFLGKKDGEYWVVDWKTDRLGPKEMKDKYQDQMNFYLQGLRGVLGKDARVIGVLANLRTGQVQKIS